MSALIPDRAPLSFTNRQNHQSRPMLGRDLSRLWCRTGVDLFDETLRYVLRDPSLRRRQGCPRPIDPRFSVVHNDDLVGRTRDLNRAQRPLRLDKGVIASSRDDFRPWERASVTWVGG